MENILDNVYVILVEPKNAGNIGSTVRAMKNMGISHLRLVNPVEYREVGEQKRLGYRSQEIIEASEEFETLEDALKDISLAVLATSKKGKWKKDFVNPSEAADLILPRLDKEKAAIVFGREDKGVTVDESQMANYYVYIPSAVSYPSLNLSQAVLVIMYEIFKGTGRNQRLAALPEMATKDKYERIFENYWDLMKSMELPEDEKGLFYRSFKRSLSRTQWADADISVFDRICKQTRWYIDKIKAGKEE